MWTIFDSYDHLMIVDTVFVSDDQYLFCLFAIATLYLKKGFFLHDNSSQTTEAVGL